MAPGKPFVKRGLPWSAEASRTRSAMVQLSFFVKRGNDGWPRKRQRLMCYVPGTVSRQHPRCPGAGASTIGNAMASALRLVKSETPRRGSVNDWECYGLGVVSRQKRNAEARKRQRLGMLWPRRYVSSKAKRRGAEASRIGVLWGSTAWQCCPRGALPDTGTHGPGADRGQNTTTPDADASCFERREPMSHLLQIQRL